MKKIIRNKRKEVKKYILIVDRKLSCYLADGFDATFSWGNIGRVMGTEEDLHIRLKPFGDLESTKDLKIGDIIVLGIFFKKNWTIKQRKELMKKLEELF